MPGTDSNLSECTDLSVDLARRLAPSPLPDDDLWFEDGNVILAVGDKEFKLYRGPLMAHSLAFRDMLSLPQPESGPASADDACPVIRLDESVENLRHLLRRIPLSRTLTSVNEPSFDEVYACIVLGRKYKCEKIVTQYIEYLRKFYPSYYKDYEPRFPSNPPPSNPPAFRPIDCVGVVNLARSIGEDTLLPVALARCMDIPFSELSAGFVRADGVRETCSLDDIVRIVEAQKNLAQLYARANASIFASTSCEDHACSDRTFPDLYAELVNEKTLPQDPLLLAPTYVEFLQRTHLKPHGLCQYCYDTIIYRARKQHEVTFDNLPTAMGVVVKNWNIDPQVLSLELLIARRRFRKVDKSLDM
ncbi:hypothetical protein C8Q70DRAFT_1016816 [Cubamyces menziesii]|nr:hypothetical protein C8Q70DRAFT_1016816 [Cubamyces menziesii]